jgi:hypothetical protein
MSPSGEESPDDGDADLDAIQSDLLDMQSSLSDHYALLERGPEIRDEHVIESEVEVVVPPIIADYVRAVVREAAAMTVEERDQFLYEELVGFEVRTTRYRFPDGDVLEAGPDRVVLRHPPDGSVEG